MFVMVPTKVFSMGCSGYLNLHLTKHLKRHLGTESSALRYNAVEMSMLIQQEKQRQFSDVPLQSFNFSASFSLAERHLVSTWGTNTNSSRTGGLCCCCRRGATVACRPQIWTPPATMVSRHRLTWTSMAAEIRET